LRAAEIYRKSGRVGLDKIMLRYKFFMLIISIPYCLCVSIFASSLLTEVFGYQYINFKYDVMILAVAAVIQNFVFIQNIYLRVFEKSKYIFKSESAAGVVILILYITLPFGEAGQGVAAAAVSSQAIKLFFLTRYVKNSN
jgi:O-antigen/teichoic acid export membrane protein